MFSDGQKKKFELVMATIMGEACRGDAPKSGVGYIPTPFELCGEIVAQIKDAVGSFDGKTFLVIDTPEFIPVLLAFGVNKCNITLVAPYAMKGRIAANWGVTVIQQDLLSWETDMKFDVVVGNPPYQSGNGERGGKHSLWRKFVRRSFEIAAAHGYVAMICPEFPVRAKDLGKHFKENSPIWLNNNVKGYFPGIGSEIKAWVVQKGNHQKNFVVDGNVLADWPEVDPTINSIERSIRSKIAAFPTFICKQDKGYSSTQLKNDPIEYFESPTGSHVFPIRHASKIKVGFVSKPTECHYKNKVMMTFSGYPNFEYYDGKATPMSSCYQMSGYIEVADQDQGRALIRLYTSKLYRYLSSLEGAGMRGINNYSLPRVDLTKVWSDQALYAYFGLSQNEIDYIEEKIK